MNIIKQVIIKSADIQFQGGIFRNNIFFRAGLQRAYGSTAFDNISILITNAGFGKTKRLDNADIN